MDITREHIDELNAIVKVSITKEDYTQKSRYYLKRLQEKG